MDGKPKRISARRVRPFFMRLFRASAIGELLQLKDAITDGESFDGKRNDTCVYGNLAKGAGCSFVDKTPDEISDDLRAHGRRIGIPIKADGHLDEIERFCAQAGRGDSVLNHQALQQIEEWLNFVLMEKGFNPFRPSTQVSEDVVLGV